MPKIFSRQLLIFWTCQICVHNMCCQVGNKLSCNMELKLYIYIYKKYHNYKVCTVIQHRQLSCVATTDLTVIPDQTSQPLHLKLL